MRDRIAAARHELDAAMSGDAPNDTDDAADEVVDADQEHDAG